jgi:K+-transporting ATPase ATPase C chain
MHRELINPADLNPGLGRIVLKQFRAAAVVLLALTLITGAAYPLAVTGLAQLVSHDLADGSLLTRDSKVVGSSLIGQEFSDPKYFWGRLSATGPMAYNAAASSGSNYGPLNPSLVSAAQARVDALRAAATGAGLPESSKPVPQDLVTASGSGLDPHISPAAADYQAERVAKVRGVEASVVRQLIRDHTSGRQFGIFGEPRVNVLALNLALDEQSASVRQ